MEVLIGKRASISVLGNMKSSATATLIKYISVFVSLCLLFQPRRSCVQSSRRSNIVQACSRPSWFASWRDGIDFATNCRRTTTLSQLAFRLSHKNDVRMHTSSFALILKKTGLSRWCYRMHVNFLWHSLVLLEAWNCNEKTTNAVSSHDINDLWTSKRL